MSKREYWVERFSVVDPLERVIAYMDYCYGSESYLDKGFLASECGDEGDAYKLVNYVAQYLRKLHPQGIASTAWNEKDNPWIRWYSQHDEIYWGREIAIKRAKERLDKNQSSTPKASEGEKCP